MPVLVVPPQELAGFVPDFDVVLADLSTLTEEEPLLAPLYDPRKKLLSGWIGELQGRGAR